VIREFRATATLTAAQLVTSWIQVSLTLVEARDTAERQLAAEERKKGGKVGRGGGLAGGWVGRAAAV
jgi:cohesin complex subunit SA-1/2